jgi:hypothetical protein
VIPRDSTIAIFPVLAKEEDIQSSNVFPSSFCSSVPAWRRLTYTTSSKEENL